jgi:polyisoprenyl-phosphate glycosyltransferase
VVVMDADGEDDPRDVTRLIARFRDVGRTSAVFARRLRRSESLRFRFFYQLYRMLHRIASGLAVQIGNFSVLPASAVNRLIVVPELWNHYAAACVHARLPITLVPTARGPRIAGHSRMNFVGLVGHGLAAISVFGERIGARSLLAVVSLSVALLLAAAIFMMSHAIRHAPMPIWSALVAGFLALFLMQALLLAFLFSFLTHAGRAASGFLPARDYEWFIERTETLWSADA